MADQPKNSLQWYPNAPIWWLSDPAVQQMRPEQEGAYRRLFDLMWRDGTVEPWLPSDDASLAFMSRLGERWKTLGGLIRAQFEERDGRLYSAHLSTIWGQQQEKYRAASSKGRRGGENKAAKTGTGKHRGSSASSPATTPSPAKRVFRGPESVAQLAKSVAGLVAGPVAQGVAQGVAIEGSLSENLEPGGAPQAAHAAGSDRQDVQLELAIGAKVEAYRLAHPEDAAVLENDVRAELRVSRNRVLSREEQARVERRMLERLDGPSLKLAQ